MLRGADAVGLPARRGEQAMAEVVTSFDVVVPDIRKIDVGRP